MAVRTFEDESRTTWPVWEVVPGHHTTGSPAAGIHLRRERAGGWLAFEAGDEKRRLFPVPDGWEEASEADLRQWCRAGDAVARRLVDEGPG